MLTIPVPLGDRAYDVTLGDLKVETIADTLAQALGAVSGVAVLVDGHLCTVNPRVDALVSALRGRFERVGMLRLAGGEACKTFAHLESTCEWLAAEGFDRSASLVSIGGGATSDHVGFAASIYLRGVSFALVPTTLLAMVDASVGGKTAVDLRAGKNLVGAFHQPRAVVADLGFLETLPARELAAGMAEVVKAAFIADAGLLEALEGQRGGLAEWPREALVKAIAASIRMKVDVVTEDERETGRRAILNFGHTLGHAIETASQYGLLHGEAVGLGMLAALRLGEVRGKTPAGLRERCQALLEKLGLPVNVRDHLTPETVRHVEVDKKRRSGNVKFVFVTKPGETVLENVPLEVLRDQAPRLFAEQNEPA